MRQHRRVHMMVPPCVFAHCRVIYPTFGFPCFTAWLDAPPQSTEPHTGI